MKWNLKNKMMDITGHLKIIIGIFILLLCFCISGYSQNITHEVKKGETLFSIAKQYDVNVQQIREWNNLNSNDLNTNQTLIVGKAQSQETDKDSLVHKVQKQETLFSISKEYGVTISELKSWNNLDNNNLNLGQTLVIYPSETEDQQQESIVDNDEEVQNNAYYLVKSGDSLYRIAQEHNMTVDELKELNGLTANNISVGQRLTVRETSSPPSVAENASSSPQGKFISYRVTEEDENLQQILQKFDMDEVEFKALNPSVNAGSISRGQQLTILAPSSRNYENPYRTNAGLKDLGKASVTRYSESEKGKPTTNGELYNSKALTAAHPNISMGTVIYIQNPVNQQGVYIRINDRISGNGLKISDAAWNALSFSSTNPTVNIFQD